MEERFDGRINSLCSEALKSVDVVQRFMLLKKYEDALFSLGRINALLRGIQGLLDIKEDEEQW